jgi:ribosomal-protein-alanine N-acetyltransferase
MLQAVQGPMEFSTQRLTSRPLAEADEALFCDLYADAETMRFIGPPLSRERAARGFRSILKLMRVESADQVFFTISDRDTQQAIGISSIQHLDPAGRRAEAGIIIASKHRARGFAKEGLSGLLRFAFDTLPIDEVWVQIAVDHTVVEKLVIGVGLARGAQITAKGGQSAMRIWSAHRDSWTHPAAGNLPGERNVGRY